MKENAKENLLVNKDGAVKNPNNKPTVAAPGAKPSDNINIATPGIKSEAKPVTPGVRPEVKPEMPSAKPEVKPGPTMGPAKSPVSPTVKPQANIAMNPDALADKINENSHGLSKAQIESMTFGDILRIILKDKDVTDVTFNGSDIFIQHNRKGRYRFSHDVKKETIENFIKDIANQLNEHFNVENPIIDCEIKDLYTEKGNAVLRLNAVHHSVSPYGNTVAIRITQPELRLTESDRTFATIEVFKLIEAMVRGNLNILISGRTGSGKTELQKFLVNYIRDAETIVLIEDTKDTDLKDLYPNKNISSWITNLGITPPVDFDTLIRASLRNNPDWIIVSETRGSEAYQMIKSGLSGHKIITTLHSDSADSNIDRLIHMCKEKYDLDQLLLGKMITNVFDIGIHIDYDITESGTKRYICEIVEYKDYTDKGVIVNPIFSLKSQPIKKPDGTITYEKVNQIGKISKTLFNKLAKKQVLSQEIEQFVEEGYYGKENRK